MLGMVHTSRKNNEKQNSIVYGVATDGFNYHFWRIDNDSNVSWNPSLLLEKVVD
jgi:outer membrane usher protein FimD/PapC